MESAIYGGDAMHVPEQLLLLKEYMDRWGRAVAASEKRLTKELEVKLTQPFPTASEIEKDLWQAIAYEADFGTGERWFPAWAPHAIINPEDGDTSPHLTLYEYTRLVSAGYNATFLICMNSITKDLSLLELISTEEGFNRRDFFPRDPSQFLQFNIKQAAKVLRNTLESVFKNMQFHLDEQKTTYI